MLKYFIEVVAELTIAALVIALVFAVAARLRFAAQRKWMLRSLALALVLGLIVAVLKQNTRLVNQEWLNLYTLSVFLVSGLIYLFVLIASFSGRIKFKDSGLNALLGSLVILSVSFYPLPDFLLHPTDFVLSDQSIFSTDFLFRAIGYGLAAVLVFLMSVALFHIAAHRLSTRRALFFCALIIIIALLSHGGTQLQFLLARRFIPMSHSTFAVVKFTVNHADVFVFSALAVLLAPAVLVFCGNLRPHGSYANPAELRKLKASAIHSRRWAVLSVVLAAIAVFDLTWVKSYANQGFTLSPAESYEVRGGDIYIPLTQISDKHLHRFERQASNGSIVRFIVIQKQGAAFGVGFDACEICGATGYYERNGQVICMLCDVVMNINTIGYKGGCNPIPLEYRIEQGYMVIETAALDAQMKRFR